MLAKAVLRLQTLARRSQQSHSFPTVLSTKIANQFQTTAVWRYRARFRKPPLRLGPGAQTILPLPRGLLFCILMLELLRPDDRDAAHG
jgi:hypothetical protein